MACGRRRRRTAAPSRPTATARVGGAGWRSRQPGGTRRLGVLVGAAAEGLVELLVDLGGAGGLLGDDGPDLLGGGAAAGGRAGEVRRRPDDGVDERVVDGPVVEDGRAGLAVQLERADHVVG